MRYWLLMAGAPAGCDVSVRPMASTPAAPAEKVVYEKIETLRDGGSLSMAVMPGKYRVHMTATDDGAHVEWVGAAALPPACPKMTNTYTGEGRFDQTGQVVVNNPTTFGMGKTVTVTMTITALRY
jgi:hypothetical protein